MPAQVTMTVTGIKELDRKLTKVGKDAPKVIRTAARLGALPVQRAAKSNIRSRSGQLAKSVKIRSLKRNKRGFIGVAVKSGLKTIGTKSKPFDDGEEAFYWAFQEFGWKLGRRGGTGRPQLTASGNWVTVPAVNYPRREVKGSGYMSKAAQQKEGAASQIFRRSILSGITKSTEDAAKLIKADVKQGVYDDA